MTPLTLKDIKEIAAYEAERHVMRQRIIALKKIRRVHLGPRVAVVFENRDTMRFQVQEMCRIERIVDPALVQQELDCYNDLLPSGLAIGATLLIELVQEDDMPTILKQLSGLEETVWLSIGAHQLHAQAETGRSTDEKTSSVHYLTFQFGPDLRQALAEADEVVLSTRHPHYAHQTRLSQETVASLLADLMEPS